MRSEGAEGSSSTSDCDDPLVVIACAAETDACPAACREDAKEDEDQAPKSGSLEVSATSVDSKVFIGRPSDLDVLTFRTSEEVEITKVVLERYGYSVPKNVYRVWLEDENGAIISNQTDLDSKGQAKLSIKKDYRKVDGEFNATIVLEAEGTKVSHAGYTATKAGATFGFKVVDVTSSAEDVNLDNYKPATYEAIDYDGSSVILTQRGSTTPKTYNFEAGKMYEVIKFKIQSPDDSAIKVNGFTLENFAATKLDLNKYFNEAEVTIAGEKVSKLSVEANKSNELVVSFKDFEVPAKSRSDVVVKISLADDLDVFGNSVKLRITKLNAVDSKVSSRVDTTLPDYTVAGTDSEYIFAGGKIKLASVKLGNVDAAQNSEDILVAEGTIEVPEALSNGAFTIRASGKGAGAIKQLTIIVNGDDYDATPVLADYDSQGSATAPTAWTAKAYTNGQYATWSGAIYKANTNTNATSFVDTEWDLVSTDYDFSFAGVEFEKSGKVKFTVDIYDNPSWNNQSVEFGTFKTFTALDYDESSKPAQTNVSGSISFSKLTIQASRASMSNSLSKDVEFMNKATNREVVFDGTYTAKKGDIKLNEFSLTYNAGSDTYDTTAGGKPENVVTFYLYVDGDLVADKDATYVAGSTSYIAADTFDNVLVKDGESVKVRVEAEVEADNVTLTKALALGKYSLEIRGEDENGNLNSGKGKANTVAMKVVEKGSVIISDTSSTKQTVIRKASDAVLAQFTVKPADGASSVTLEEIEFRLAGINGIDASDAKVTLKIDNIEEDDFRVTGSSSPYTLTYDMNREVKSEGATVLVTINDEVNGAITLDKLSINGKAQTKEFTKKYVTAAVEIVKQESRNGSTIFTLSVDKPSDVDVRNFTVYYTSKTSGANTPATLAKVEDGKTLSVNGEADYKGEVTSVSYEYTRDALAGDVATPVQAKATLTMASAISAVKDDEITIDGTVWVVDADTSSSTSVAVTQKTAADLATATAAAPTNAATYKTVNVSQIAITTAGVTAVALGDTIWDTETILKSGVGSVPDYFEVDGEDLAIFKL